MGSNKKVIQINIRFGINDKPLRQQLKLQGFKFNNKSMNEFEKIRKGINIFCGTSFLNAHQIAKLSFKLHNQIQIHKNQYNDAAS